MHTVFALLCFVVVIHWLIFPYPSGLLHWHFGNLTIAPVPAKQPWWIWINTSGEFMMNDCITTTKQSTTKPCAYFLGYTVHRGSTYKQNARAYGNVFMPPPLGAGGIMFSGCPSVRPKPEIPSFDLYMDPLVHPTNRYRFTACPSVRPSGEVSGHLPENAWRD